MTNRIFALKVREKCRELRKSQTKAESLLWQELRNRKLGGLKFTRQHPLFVSDGRGIRYYIADCYCHEKRLVVELDGPVHDRTHARDQDRDELISLLNLRVLRINNVEIEKDIEKVLKRLQDA